MAACPLGEMVLGTSFSLVPAVPKAGKWSQGPLGGQGHAIVFLWKGGALGNLPGHWGVGCGSFVASNSGYLFVPEHSVHALQQYSQLPPRLPGIQWSRRAPPHHPERAGHCPGPGQYSREQFSYTNSWHPGMERGLETLKPGCQKWNSPVVDMTT